MGDHLGNRMLLAFPDPIQAEVYVSKRVDCRQIESQTPVTKYLSSYKVNPLSNFVQIFIIAFPIMYL